MMLVCATLWGICFEKLRGSMWYVVVSRSSSYCLFSRPADGFELGKVIDVISLLAALGLTTALLYYINMWLITMTLVTAAVTAFGFFRARNVQSDGATSDRAFQSTQSLLPLFLVCSLYYESAFVSYLVLCVSLHFRLWFCLLLCVSLHFRLSLSL